MKIKELFETLGSMKSPFETDKNIPDDETRDRAVQSLRRQKRMIIDDRREKLRLREQIKKELRRQDRAFLQNNKKNSILNERSFLTPIKKVKTKKILTRKSTLLK